MARATTAPSTARGARTRTTTTMTLRSARIPQWEDVSQSPIVPRLAVCGCKSGWSFHRTRRFRARPSTREPRRRPPGSSASRPVTPWSSSPWRRTRRSPTPGCSPRRPSTRGWACGSSGCRTSRRTRSGRFWTWSRPSRAPAPRRPPAAASRRTDRAQERSRSEPGGRRGPDRDDSAAEAVPGAGDGERRPRVGLAVEEQDSAVRRERDAGELAAVEGVAGERERPVLAGGADEVLLAVAVLGQDDAAAVRGDGDVVGAVEAAARLEDELELDLVAARVVGPDLAGVVPGGALVRARVAGDEVRLAVAPPGAFELLAAGDLTVLELLADGGLPGQRVGDVDPPGRQPGAGFGDERQVGDAGDLQRLQLPAGPVGVVAAAARAREEPEEQPERPGRVLGEVGDVGVRVDG